MGVEMVEMRTSSQSTPVAPGSWETWSTREPGRPFGRWFCKWTSSKTVLCPFHLGWPWRTPSRSVQPRTWSFREPAGKSYHYILLQENSLHPGLFQFLVSARVAQTRSAFTGSTCEIDYSRSFNLPYIYIISDIIYCPYSLLIIWYYIFPQLTNLLLSWA